KRRLAFIGLPSPLGRGSSEGERGSAYKMHTSSPRLREGGHSRPAAILCVLVFASILRKKRVREERDLKGGRGPHVLAGYSRAGGGLGQGVAIRVVHHPHRAAEPSLEITLERPTVEPGGVGVLHEGRWPRSSYRPSRLRCACLSARPSRPCPRCASSLPCRTSSRSVS